MLHPGTGHGGDLQRLLRAIGQPLDPDVQRVAQGVGHVHAAARRRGGQLGHEVGQTLAAPVHQVDGDSARCPAQQAGQQVGHLGSAETADLQPGHPGQSSHLGQERPQRMASVQLVGAVGGDHQHRGIGQGAGQEAQQVPGRLVGPVQVLDHHHQRPGPCGRLPEPGHRLEQLQPEALRLARRGDQIREQGAQTDPAGAGPLEHLVATVPGDQLPQGTDDRRVRQSVAAQRHALSADDLRTPVGRRRRQVVHERVDDRRLARAGVAADQREPTPLDQHAVQQVPQSGQLVDPADQLHRPAASRRPNPPHRPPPPRRSGEAGV